MSVKWLYCPKARFDLHTGQGTTPCRSAEYYPAQAAKSDCSLQNCAFKTLGGAWMCCECGSGPNNLGWCTAPKDPARAATWAESMQQLMATTTTMTTTTTANMDQQQRQQQQHNFHQNEYQQPSPPMDDDEGSFYYGAAESSASGSASGAGGGASWDWKEGYPELCGHGCCEACTPVYDMLNGHDADTASTSTSGRHRKRGRKEKSGSKR